MAVFEYRGILIGNGKAVKGVRDAESPKVLRSILRKDGILLTTVTEGQAAEAIYCLHCGARLPAHSTGRDERTPA